ncbi:ABC transporter ATP-binding protein [Desulfuribacillus alkaliarsenatis]|uniref:ABC transporter domain-containing protein n=1 Tax=Desulfuribacillus alkaliarsenatis TaxID=766136 RepID=A0A1E5FZ97_9FIRM|nr:ABC transporter ATP-binding protein [Desulfuribacillus alkaliarsenatis]OEF95904.1 hypothetical protein BHF68_10965 [Desulfuribacillus alkaliarsenatis]
MIVGTNITFSYQNHPILSGINVTIEPGKIYGFLGRNGSGKTTMLRVINGLLKPQHGDVKIHTDTKTLDVHKESRALIAKEIGFVPQEHRGVFPYRVLEMVVMGRNPHLGYFERPKDEDYQEAIKALQDIGIQHLWDKSFMEISGGERQMVLIARVIAQGAKYLILDEPTSHLDFKNQHQILQLVKNISRERQVAAIMAMHDPNLAVCFADHILMLKHGRLMAEGAVDHVMTEVNLKQLYDMNIDLSGLPCGRKYVLPAI